MPTIVEVIQAALGGGDGAAAAIKLLEDHRRGLARSFLTSTGPEESLPGRVPEVAALASSCFPWDPTPEDYDLAQAILERWRQTALPEPNVVMAAMALAPAHHFPVPPRLALVPQWLRPTYVRYLLARAPLFLHPGEADRYATHGIQAMAAVRDAVFEDRPSGVDELAGIAASADSTLIYFSGQSLRAYFRDKARIAEWAMLRQGHQLGFGFPLQTNLKPRIGVLHRTLAPGTETYHLLGHLEGRDRSTAEVTIYVLDATPKAMTEVFTPWIDGFVQLPADIPGAVARLRADGLDVCFFTNNLGWGLTRETAIASHRVARVQVVSGACPATPGISASDLFLSSQGNDPLPTAQDDYVERLVFLPGAVGRFGYAHDIEPPTLSCSRQAIGVPDDDVFFFSGANYYKIEPEILETWAELLARTPGSSLGLMPFNPNWGGNYPLALFMRRLNRELVRFGVAPSRVRLIGQVPTRADLLAIMRLADVYLDSFPYSGACSLVDPLLVGLPIVARAGIRLRTAQGASLLRAEGLDDAVCADAEAYVERAVRLAQDRAFRKDEADRVRRASVAGLACLDTRAFAQRFSAFCVDAAQAAHDRIAAQRLSSPKALRREIAHAAAAALAEPPTAFLVLNHVELARQLLAPWLQTLAAEGATAGRVIDSRDQRSVPPPGAVKVPASTLGEHLRQQPGEVDLIEIACDGSGLDILLGLDLSAAPAKAIMADFDAARPGQSPAAVAKAIAGMEAKGYGAAVFEYRRLQSLPVVNADHELADVAFDAKRLGKRGDGFGEIIFHRSDDTAFLTCLAQLLEGYGPAPNRPAFACLSNGALARPAVMAAGA